MIASLGPKEKAFNAFRHCVRLAILSFSALNASPVGVWDVPDVSELVNATVLGRRSWS